MIKDNWIGWNYKSRPDEIIDLVLDEVNDMLKKNKLKINYQYNDDNEEGWDYFLELTKDNI
jgi:outer membrane receptor for Fe3+-dicitrate